MVTTIKITCDGVFIEAHSYQISGEGSNSPTPTATAATTISTTTETILTDTDNNNTNYNNGITNRPDNRHNNHVIFNTFVNCNQIGYSHKNNSNSYKNTLSISSLSKSIIAGCNANSTVVTNDVVRAIVNTHKSINNSNKPISIRHTARSACGINTNVSNKIHENCRIINASGTTTAIAIRRRNTFKNCVNDCKEYIFYDLPTYFILIKQLKNVINCHLCFLFHFHLQMSI